MSLDVLLDPILAEDDEAEMDPEIFGDDEMKDDDDEDDGLGDSIVED